LVVFLPNVDTFSKSTSNCFFTQLFHNDVVGIVASFGAYSKFARCRNFSYNLNTPVPDG
jgi:hypothetical protein